MSMVFDRTQADVDDANQIIAKLNHGIMLTAKEQELYDAGLKGRYNYTDVNRVEAKAAELAGLLQRNGYPVELETRTDWTGADEMRYDDIVRYIDNIRRIRECFDGMSNMPPAVPLTRWLDYAAANDIERTLWVVESAIDSIAAYLRRSGTFTAGGSYSTQMIRRAT